MATTKKPAAKAPAAKKPAVKKPAAKAPAAKKPVAKKPAAKAPAVKKPAAVKAPAKTPAKAPAVKKPAAVKPAAKVPAAKAPAAKTPAVKKPAALKPDVKAPAKAPAVKKPVEKAPAEKAPAEKTQITHKNRDLFDAFKNNDLPHDHGYIVSSFFNPQTAYAIYEIVTYAGVKEIFPTANGLQFIAGGKKLHVLVENDTYAKKFIEPVNRVQGESIPKRFNELEIIIARNQTKIMVAKEPIELYGQFTILNPSSLNFSRVFYQNPDQRVSMAEIAEFFTDSLNRLRKIPHADAKKAAQYITAIVEKSMSFKGEYGS